MRGTGAVVRLTVSPGAAQQHGLGHLLAQPSPRPPQRSAVTSDHQGETETRDMRETRDMTETRDMRETRDPCPPGDNYMNQEWLAMTAGVGRGRELPGPDHQEAEDGVFIPEQPPHGFGGQQFPPDQGGQHYQNLAAIREQASLQPRSPRPMSMHVSSASGVHPHSLPNSQSIQNISQDPEEGHTFQSAVPLSSNAFNSRGFSNVSNIHSSQTLPSNSANNLVRQAMGGSQNILGSSNSNTLPYKNSPAVIGNFARINSGRFRPIHPAPSLDKITSLAHKNSSDIRSVVRKGPIRKDGSIVLSPPKHSPALSQQSGSSDKENSGNPNIWISKEDECDNVFIEKEPESVCSEVSRVSQIQSRTEKKVSFTPLMTTVHDVTREEGETDVSRQSLDTIDDPDGFIDGAENLLNLDQIDIHQKISVVGNQVTDALSHSCQDFKQ